MANVLFCWPDWTQPTSQLTPTFTDPGTAWLDLDLLQGDCLSEMARCTSILPAASKLNFDLKASRPVRVIAIPMHSAKPGDKARVKIATDAAMTSIVLDTGWVDFYGTIYPFGSQPWGSESWWSGTLSAEAAADYRVSWLYVAGSEVLGRYGTLEIDASGNPDGYIDIGRLVVARGWSPKINISRGWQAGWRDSSRKTRAKGGAGFADREPSRRWFRMNMDWLEIKEAFGGPWEMQRTLGTTEPFLFVHDPADTELSVQRTCMVTATNLAGITHQKPGINTFPLELEEEL